MEKAPKPGAVTSDEDRWRRHDLGPITYDPKTDRCSSARQRRPWPAEIRDPAARAITFPFVDRRAEAGYRRVLWHYQEVQRDSWDYTPYADTVRT